MDDLEIRLADTPGSLSVMGTALGNAGISIEGGGAWVVDGKGFAHFLFHDGAAARRASTKDWTPSSGLLHNEFLGDIA